MKRTPIRSGIYLIILLLFAGIASGCGEQKEMTPDPVTDYEGFIRFNADRICEKSLRCMVRLTRSMSPETKKLLDAEQCKNAALKNLEEKLALHTPQMKMLSVSCYQAILDSSCKKFAETAYWDLNCLQLRKLSKKVYREAEKNG